MPREIDLSKKLSKEDVEWLQSRYPDSYVERQIELAGGVKGKKETAPVPETPAPTLETPETPPETPSGDSSGEPATPEQNAPENGEEDLIGDVDESKPPFDPSAHNVDDVVAHLKAADDDEKSRVLAAEAAGKGRSTVLNA